MSARAQAVRRDPPAGVSTAGPKGSRVGRRPSVALVVVAWMAMPGAARGQTPSDIRELDSPTTALLQAVSPVDARTVWVSGHEGAVLLTRDGGDTWRANPAPGGDSLEFRDVHGFDDRRAVILSAGEGAASRIYRTDDGGDSWSLVWSNPEPAGFYDCLAFWDDRRGLAYGDAVDGGLRVLLTEDGGRSWERAPSGALPEALEGEGGFAASGTCVETGPDGRAWIGTGAGARPRVLRTLDHGRSWRAQDLPIVTGSAAGAFTVVFRDAANGIVLGGDLERPDGVDSRAAVTADGGATWRVAPPPPFAGPVYGAARVPWIGVLLAAGPGGLAMADDGISGWRALDDRSWWAVGAADGTAWAVGPGGRILRITWDPP